MDIIGKFSIEQLELIRLLAGEKITALHGALRNISGDQKVKKDRKSRKIFDLSDDINKLEALNEIAVILINETHDDEES